MIDLHDWWKVVDDLSEKHDLNERQKAEQEERGNNNPSSLEPLNLHIWSAPSHR